MCFPLLLIPVFHMVPCEFTCLMYKWAQHSSTTVLSLPSVYWKRYSVLFPLQRGYSDTLPHALHHKFLCILCDFLSSLCSLPCSHCFEDLRNRGHQQDSSVHFLHYVPWSLMRRQGRIPKTQHWRAPWVIPFSQRISFSHNVLPVIQIITLCTF